MASRAVGWSGYPDGLKGDDIPVPAQVMAIVDVYDALATERPYKGAFPREVCFDILRANAQYEWWNPEYVEALIEVIEENAY